MSPPTRGGDPSVRRPGSGRRLPAALDVGSACDFAFPATQTKSYRKTEFVLHSRVAELVASQLSGVFYEEGGPDGGPTWLVTPENLRDMVLTNILQESEGEGSAYSRYPIYGSAIAFEPGVWTDVDGLEEGVTYPAASEACLEDPDYCEDTDPNATSYEVTDLVTNGRGTIYCPFGFRGPPDQAVYGGCSPDGPRFCPSMDLSRAYDYSDVSNALAEWYTAPRCLYLRDGVEAGYWTSPYFDEGAGNINMVTYSQPIISRDGTFLGVATIDVEVDALCYADQCDVAVDYNYLTNIRPLGLLFASVAMIASLLCLGWTQYHRRHKVVVASQPFFLRIICVGCLVLSSSIIPLSYDDSIASAQACSRACMAFPWLLSVGFSAVFAALFSKVWRLNKVMANAQVARRVKVKIKDVLTPFFVLMGLNLILMVLWTTVAPRVWVRTVPDENYESYGYCESGKGANALIGLIAVVNIAALVLANVQAFRARKISMDFSESFWIGMIMVCILQALVLGIPIMIIVESNIVAEYFLWSGLIFVATMAVLGMLFLPKMLAVRNGQARNSSPPVAVAVAVAVDESTTNNETSNCTNSSEPPQSVEISSVNILEDGNRCITGTF